MVSWDFSWYTSHAPHLNQILSESFGGNEVVKTCGISVISRVHQSLSQATRRQVNGGFGKWNDIENWFEPESVLYTEYCKKKDGNYQGIFKRMDLFVVVGGYGKRNLPELRVQDCGL